MPRIDRYNSRAKLPPPADVPEGWDPNLLPSVVLRPSPQGPSSHDEDPIPSGDLTDFLRDIHFLGVEMSTDSDLDGLYGEVGPRQPSLGAPLPTSSSSSVSSPSQWSPVSSGRGAEPQESPLQGSIGHSPSFATATTTPSTRSSVTAFSMASADSPLTSPEGPSSPTTFTGAYADDTSRSSASLGDFQYNKALLHALISLYMRRGGPPSNLAGIVSVFGGLGKQGTWATMLTMAHAAAGKEAFQPTGQLDLRIWGRALSYGVLGVSSSIVDAAMCTAQAAITRGGRIPVTDPIVLDIMLGLDPRERLLRCVQLQREAARQGSHTSHQFHRPSLQVCRSQQPLNGNSSSNNTSTMQQLGSANPRQATGARELFPRSPQVHTTSSTPTRQSLMATTPRSPPAHLMPATVISSASARTASPTLLNAMSQPLQTALAEEAVLPSDLGTPMPPSAFHPPSFSATALCSTSNRDTTGSSRGASGSSSSSSSPQITTHRSASNTCPGNATTYGATFPRSDRSQSSGPTYTSRGVMYSGGSSTSTSNHSNNNNSTTNANMDRFIHQAITVSTSQGRAHTIHTSTSSSSSSSSSVSRNNNTTTTKKRRREDPPSLPPAAMEVDDDDVPLVRLAKRHASLTAKQLSEWASELPWHEPVAKGTKMVVSDDLNARRLGRFTLNKLQKLCAAKKLSMSGNKRAVVERLMRAARSHYRTPSSPPSAF